MFTALRLLAAAFVTLQQRINVFMRSMSPLSSPPSNIDFSCCSAPLTKLLEQQRRGGGMREGGVTMLQLLGSRRLQGHYLHHGRHRDSGVPLTCFRDAPNLNSAIIRSASAGRRRGNENGPQGSADNFFITPSKAGNLLLKIFTIAFPLVEVNPTGL